MFACEICTDLLRFDDDVSTIPCGHIFHLKCLEDWCRTQSNPTCPKCRNIFCRKQVIEKLYFERMEGNREGEDLQSKIEVLESTLVFNENERNKLFRDKQQLETDLSFKEIQKVTLEAKLEQYKITIQKMESVLKVHGTTGHPGGYEPENARAAKAQIVEQGLIDVIRRKDELINTLTEDNALMQVELTRAEISLAIAKRELLELRNASIMNPQKMNQTSDDHPFCTASTSSDDEGPTLEVKDNSQVGHESSRSATTTELDSVNETPTENSSAGRRGVKRRFSEIVVHVDVENVPPEENKSPRLVLAPVNVDEQTPVKRSKA